MQGLTENVGLCESGIFFFAVRNKNIDLEKNFNYNNDKKQLLWEIFEKLNHLLDSQNDTE